MYLLYDYVDVVKVFDNYSSVDIAIIPTGVIRYCYLVYMYTSDI